MTRLVPVAVALGLLLSGAIGPLGAQRLAPDVVYYDAHVVTVNDAFEITEAVAVREGRIVAVRTNEEVLRLACPATRWVDLDGKTVLPGFYDNHIHLSGLLSFIAWNRDVVGSTACLAQYVVEKFPSCNKAGLLQEWRGGVIEAVPEWLRNVNDLEGLQAALRQRAAQVPAGEWIVGELAREDWPNQKVPNRWDLDEAAPDHPVALHRGPHTLLLNSHGLRIARITRDTPDPPGGWIIRDEDGEPAGRVLEAAERLVNPRLPHDTDSTVGWSAGAPSSGSCAGLGSPASTSRGSARSCSPWCRSSMRVRETSCRA